MTVLEDAGSRPLVSVLMNCYNSAKYLREAIDSVLAQSYQNWEIIFWDNQSTDESADIFNSYTDLRLRYFLAAKYTTLGTARNFGIHHARGVFIAFLDCDDVWYPQKLMKQIALFNNDSIGLVICDTIFFNSKKDIRQLYKRKKPPTGNVFKELLGAYFISMETPVIRRSALNEMDHWFDSRFEVIEEYDFFVRLGYTWKVAYVDEVLAKWRVHSSSWTWTSPQLFPVETRLFLDKMSALIPDFNIIYKDEIKSVLENVVKDEAIIAWSRGDSNKSRKMLNPIFCNSPKLFLIYIWTLFPYSTFKFVASVRTGLLS
jgi:glycosyltransferase involved in cell wall biosynthesis